MAGKSKDKGASEKEKYHNLIAEHKIVFEGPTPSEQWPLQYAHIFREVHELDRIRYNEYVPNRNRGFLTVSEVKVKAVRLTKVSYELREGGENENTWRLRTEPILLDRFEDEIAW